MYVDRAYDPVRDYRDGDGWDMSDIPTVIENPVSLGETVMPLRGARCFEVSGNKWKTIEKLSLPLGTTCAIRWNGWITWASDLTEHDWVMTVVTNNFTNKKKLYVRDPITKLCGAGELKEHKQFSCGPTIFSADLDYFCHEKNQRIKKFIKEIPSDAVIQITEDNIPAVLDYIAELQNKDKKLRRKQIRTPAEILQLIRIAA